MRGRRALVLLAAIWLGCGPLVGLQLVAWIGMIGSYSWTSGSFATGVEQTFDGDHPCPLCCAITTEREHPALPVVDEQGNLAKIFLDAPSLPALDALPVVAGCSWRAVWLPPLGWAAAPRPPPPRDAI